MLGGGSGYGGWTYLISMQSQTDAFGLLYSGMVDRLAVGLPLALADKKASGTVIANLFAYTSTGFMDLPPFDQVRGTCVLISPRMASFPQCGAQCRTPLADQCFCVQPEFPKKKVLLHGQL